MAPIEKSSSGEKYNVLQVIGKILTHYYDCDGLLEDVYPLIIFDIFPGFHFCLENLRSAVFRYVGKLWKQLRFAHKLISPLTDVYSAADEILI